MKIQFGTSRSIAAIFFSLLIANQNQLPVAASPEAPILPSAPRPLSGSNAVRSVPYSALPAALDLGSSTTLIAAPNTKPILLQTGSLGANNIANITGSQSSVPTLIQPGQQLTASQFLAVSQILAGGAQRLQVNQQGISTGGYASIMPGSTASALSALSIPGKVGLAVIGFTADKPFVISGLTNVAGTLFALQNQPGVASYLNLGSLNVAPGGLVTTTLPGGANPFGSGVFSSQSLVVNALHDISNSGVISSGGSLALNAGGIISNLTGANIVSTTGVQAAPSNGTIIAQDIAISTGSGSLINSGLISALNNIVIASPNSALTVNDESGSVRSIAGQISVNAGSAATHSNLNVSGGDWLAPVGGVEFSAPCADISVTANRLTGPVSLTGANAVAGAFNGDVKIASTNLSADPIFFAGGDLDLATLGFSNSGVIQPDGRTYDVYSTGGQDFVALAGGNIGCTACGITSGRAMIDATNMAGTGGKIVLAAGVNFTVASGSSSPLACTDCSSKFNILGASTGGGNVSMGVVGLRTNGAAISVQANAGSSNNGSIDILNAETSGTGGAGGTTSSRAGVAGQSAGSITILAQGTSNASSVNVGTGNYGFLRAYGGGGGGALSGNSSSAGGSGGNGANIAVYAPGFINITGEINSSGGGAGGSDTTGTAPSAGAGGNVTVMSGLGTVALGGPVLAAGGGGGGNAPNQGGGGGSFGGGGGASTNVAGTGNGGAGGGIGGGGSGAVGIATAVGGGGFFGGGGFDTGSSQAGVQGAGGGGFLFGSGGSGFGATSASGANPGANGSANGSGHSASGGGAGGTIVLSGIGGVAINSNVSNFSGFSGTGFASGPANVNSVYTSGSGTLTISEPTFNTYASSSDLSASGASDILNNPISSTVFTANAGLSTGGSGSVGRLTANVITINGHVNVSGTSTASYDMSSGTIATLLESGLPQTVTSASALTPAERVAFLQVLTGNAQNLTLTGSLGNAYATSGSLSIGPANVPTGGFTYLTLDNAVTATVLSQNVAFSSYLLLSSSANLTMAPIVPGAGTLSTGNLIFASFPNSTNMTFTSGFGNYGSSPISGVITSGSGQSLAINSITGGLTTKISNLVTGSGFLISPSDGSTLSISGVDNTSVLSFIGGPLTTTTSSGAATTLSNVNLTTDDIFTGTADGGTISLTNSAIVTSTLAPSIPTNVINFTGAGSLTLAGSSNNVVTQNANAQVVISADTLYLADGLNWSVSGALTLISPQIVVGAIGDLNPTPTAQFTATGITSIGGDSSMSAALSIAPLTGTAATLTIDGAAGTNIYSTNKINLGNNLTLSTGSAPLLFQSPQVVVGINGDIGDLNVTVTSTAAITFQGDNTSFGSLTLGHLQNSGTLNIADSIVNFNVGLFDLSGIVHVNGSNGTINVSSDLSHSLIIQGGSGDLIDNQVNFVAPVGLVFNNGAEIKVQGQLNIQTPQITIGTNDTGSVSAGIGGTSVVVQGDATTNGSITISKTASASAGVLNFFGTGNTITVGSFEIKTGTTLFADGISIASDASHGLNIPGTTGGTLDSTQLTLSSANSISFGNGMDLTLSQPSTFDSPSVILGVAGDGTGALASTIHGSVNFTSPTANFSFDKLAGAVSGTLSTGTTTVTADNFAITAGTIVQTTSGDLTVQSTASGVLTIPGNNAGSLLAANGFSTRINSTGTIYLSDLSTISAGSRLVLSSPNIVIGASGSLGAQSATISATDVFIQAQPDGYGSLRLGTTDIGGTLNVTSGVSGSKTILVDSVLFDANTTLTPTGGNGFVITANTGARLAIMANLGATITGGATFTSDSAVILGSGTDLNVTGGAVTIDSPNFIGGWDNETGGVNVQITNDTQFFLKNSYGASLFLSKTPSADVATAFLLGANIDINPDSFFQVGAIFSLISDQTGVSAIALHSVQPDFTINFSPVSSSIGGPGTFNISASHSIAVSAGSKIRAGNSGALVIDTPNFIVGSAGQTGSLQVDLSGASVKMQQGNYAPLNISAASTATSGVLVFSGPTTIATNDLTISSAISITADADISIGSAPGQTLTIQPSTPSFFLQSGPNFFKATLSSDTGISVANGLSWTCIGNIVFQTPTIVIGIAGDSAALAATFSASKSFQIKGDSSGTANVSLSTLSGATSGTLTLNGSALTLTAPVFTIGSNTTLVSNKAMTFNLSSDLVNNIGSQITASSLSIGSLTGNIGSAALPLNVTTAGLSFTGGTGSIFINDSVATTLAGASYAGSINLTDAVSITTNANLTGVGQIVLTTPIMVNANSIVVTGTNPSLIIQSPNGSSLDISGGGNFTATTSVGNPPTDGSLIISSPQNNVTISGAGINIRAQSETILSAHGTVAVTGVALVNSNGFLDVLGNFSGNPSAVVALSGTATLTPVTVGSTIGTITNPFGDVNLTNGMLINTAGKSLAILAGGNVYSTGVATINLGSTTGTSGSLTVVAGANFTPQTVANPTPDSLTTFTILGPSITGGNINLGSTNINTASFAPSTSVNKSAGTVSMAAYSGSAYAGSIYTGAITTTSINGPGGNVSLFGQGGVQVNGSITTNGGQSAGSVNIAAAKPVNPLLIYNGILISANAFAASSPMPTTGSGGAVRIAGLVSATSTNGAGGAVRLVSESELQVTNFITTSGLASGGAVTLSALNAALSIGGAITTSANNIFSSTSSTNAGPGGSVNISAPASIAIAGSILTNGGTTFGLGNGGAGGGVSIQTSTNNNSMGLYDGNIAITGGINTTGGNGKAVGGAGGALTITAGAMQINGIVAAGTSSGSIIASGGKGTAAGSNGTVNLKTFAVQSQNSSFDFLSTTRNIVALPGGLFSVGLFPVINGTAGNIVSGTLLATSANAGAVQAGSSLPIGAGSITVTPGASSTIIEAGIPLTITQATSNSNRTKVSAGQSAALYQVTFAVSGGQQVQLNGQHQVSGAFLNPSVITLPSYDVPVASAFNLTAAGTPDSIVLIISGQTPKLDLSRVPSATFNGQLEFQNAMGTAAINGGALPIVINSGASINSSGSGRLILQSAGGSWTNSGNITAPNNLILLNPGAAFTFTNSASGIVVATNIQLPSNGMPTLFSFTNKAPSGQIPIVAMQTLQLPTTFGTAAATLTTGSTQPTSSTFLLTGGGTSGPIRLTGTLTTAFSRLTILGLTSAQAQPTSVSLVNSPVFNLAQSLSFNTTGSLSITGATLSAGAAGIQITSAGATLSNSSLAAAGSVTMNLLTGSLASTSSSLTSTTGLVSISTNNGAAGLVLGSQTSIAGAAGVTIGNFGGLVSIGTHPGVASALTSSNGLVSITARNDLTLDNATISGKLGVTQTSILGGVITVVGALPESTQSTSGSITISAASGILLPSASSLQAAQSLSISAGNTAGAFTGIDLSGDGTIRAVNTITLNSRSGLSAASATITAQRVNASIAGDGNLTLSGITAPGGMSVNISSGNFTVNHSTLTSSAGFISFSNSGSGILSIGERSMVSANNGISIISAGNLQFDRQGSASGQLQLNSANGSILLSARQNLTFESSSMTAKAGFTVITQGTLQGTLSPIFNSSNGSFNATIGSTPVLNSLKITALGIAITSPGDINFSNGTIFTSNSSTLPIAITTSGKFTLTTGSSISSAQALNILSAKDLSLGQGSLFSGKTIAFQSSTGSILESGGNLITANQSMTFTAAKDVSLSINTSSVAQAATGMAITANNGSISVGALSTLTTTTGVLALRATGGTITAQGIFQAGALVGTPTGLLLNSQVQSSGSITFTSNPIGANAGGLNISSATITANGTTNSPGNITANINGNVSIDTGVVMQANGGNLKILATGNISPLNSAVTAGDTFGATGVAVSSTPGALNVGGGVEFSAGSLASQLAVAVNKTPPVVPSSLSILGGGSATNIVINNTFAQPNTSGVLQVNITTGGTLNLTNTGANLATFNLNGGAIVFDASGSKSVNLTGATFTVTAYKPIGFTTRASAPTELITDEELLQSESQAKTDKEYTRVLAHILVPGERGIRKIVSSSQSQGHDAKDGTEISLAAGQMFINSLRDTRVTTEFGLIRVKRGALVSVSVESGMLKVIACSGPNDVTVECGQKTISLMPGEELTVSKHQPTKASCADGVGRRRVRSIAFGKSIDDSYATICDISIVSFIANLPHLQSLAHATSPLERKISERLLKTAAALQQVTAGRGVYTAEPSPYSNGTASPYRPIGWSSKQ
jgi:hypothetical protein